LHASIPYESFINLDAVLPTQYSELVLIGLMLMPFVLTFDVLKNTVNEGLTDGKNAIS